MSILKKQLAKKHKKLQEIPLGAVTNAMACPTGYTMLDMYLSILCKTPKGEEFLSSGLPFGKIISFIGNSLGGKTTFALQIAYNMIKYYNGDVVVADFERSSNGFKTRFCTITGCTSEEYEEIVTLYKHLGMSTEFFKKLIFDIVDIKKELPKDAMIDWKNEDGEDIKIYPPTIVILDSIPAMRPEDVINDASLDNNMVAGRIAAANKSLFSTILNLLETYNITIFTINHITTKIVTNQWAGRKVQLPGLGEDENLPGGNSVTFYPSFIIRLTSGAELKAEKDSCNGRVTALRLLKTRSSFNNIRFNVILEERYGIHNGLSLFHYAKDAKILGSGGRAGYNFEGNPTDKAFTQKQFLKLYNNNESFKEAFVEYVENDLMQKMNFVSKDDLEETDVTEYEDDEFDD